MRSVANCIRLLNKIRRILYSDGVYSFYLDLVDCRKLVQSSNHLRQFVQSSTECIEFAKNVIFAELKLAFIRVFL